VNVASANVLIARSPPWLREEAAAWLFVTRTVLGILLALGIAFRFDLSSPGSAAVTVSIIALPQAGMVLEKSFYRLLGTFLGAVVTLLLLAGLVQHRDLFIVAVAAWIGICTAAAARFRGFQAYGWLLCGYTTCLIGFPAFGDATHAFAIAVDRVTIVSVGILSAGVVNAVILPTRSADTLVHLVRRSFIDFVSFLDAATAPGGAATLATTQQQFSRDLANLESLRGASLFEDPTSRIRTTRLSAFIGSFMHASSRLQVLHRQLDDLRSEGHGPVLAALEPSLSKFRAVVRFNESIPGSAREAAPIACQLQELLNEWDERQAGWRSTIDPPLDARGRAALLATGLLLREAVEHARMLAAVYAQLHSPRGGESGLPYHPRSVASDALLAAVGGVRTAVVLLVTCAFWIATAWPEGFSATLLAAVGCALFASVPNPTLAARQMCSGFLVGLPALLVCYTWVLPAANGFAMLCLGLLPFLAFGAWLMTRPGQTLSGSGYFLMFLTGLDLSSPMKYDFINMCNNAVAQLAGIGIAAICLGVMAPADPDWRRQRAWGLLLRSLRLAAHGNLTQLQPRFESRVRELTLQAMALRPVGRTAQADEAVGFLMLDIGDALIRWRTSMAAQGDDARAASTLIDATTDAVMHRDARALKELIRDLEDLQASAVMELAAGIHDDTICAAVTARLAALRTLRTGLIDFAAVPYAA
jgi:uncharacterized membrane protein YccC